MQGVSYAMVTNIAKRPPGRPKGFIPDEALDRAVEMFWEHGYEGVDVEPVSYTHLDVYKRQVPYQTEGSRGRDCLLYTSRCV